MAGAHIGFRRKSAPSWENRAIWASVARIGFLNVNDLRRAISKEDVRKDDLKLQPVADDY